MLFHRGKAYRKYGGRWILFSALPKSERVRLIYTPPGTENPARPKPVVRDEKLKELVCRLCVSLHGEVRRELRPECLKIADWLWDRVPLMEMPEMDRVRFSRKLFSLWFREGEVIDRLRIRDRLAAKMWSFYKRHRRMRDRQWRKAADLIERGKIEWILSGGLATPEKTPESKSMAS